MTYILVDWRSRRVLPDETFDSFEEACQAIDDLATIECNNYFKPGTPEWDELYQGVQKDLHAEEE